METLTLVLLSIIGVIIAVAVYCLADARNKTLWAYRLERELEVVRKELREWQNKALLRHGTSPLDKQAVTTNKVGHQEITPKVVTRQQLEFREATPMQNPINIHATDVSYQRVARTLEKTAEIIAAHK